MSKDWRKFLMTCVDAQPRELKVSSKATDQAPLICVSIAEDSVDDCLRALRNLDFAEVRIDLMKLSKKDVRRIFSLGKRLIATCRSGRMTDEARKALLTEAIEAGASYVDVELESSDSFRRDIIERARARGCEVILSYHDFNRTPNRKELEHIVDSCFGSGADIAKIACKVNSEMDNARLLGLLDSERRLVIAGMGERGRMTRVIAPLLGAEFTFASLSEGKETGEGQIGRKALEEMMHWLGRGLKND